MAIIEATFSILHKIKPASASFYENIKAKIHCRDWSKMKYNLAIWSHWWRCLLYLKNRLILVHYLSKTFFCWHAIQLVFLPPIVPLRGKRVVYCCYVNLWSMSMASPLWILEVSCEDRFTSTIRNTAYLATIIQ